MKLSHEKCRDKSIDFICWIFIFLILSMPLGEEELACVVRHLKENGYSKIPSHFHRRVALTKGEVEARDPMVLQKWMPFGKSCWMIMWEACSKIEQEETPNSWTTWGGGNYTNGGCHTSETANVPHPWERRAAWVKFTNEIIRDDKIKPGINLWSSPSFPVPKKKPNDYR